MRVHARKTEGGTPVDLNLPPSESVIMALASFGVSEEGLRVEYQRRYLDVSNRRPQHVYGTQSLIVSNRPFASNSLPQLTEGTTSRCRQGSLDDDIPAADDILRAYGIKGGVPAEFKEVIAAAAELAKSSAQRRFRSGRRRSTTN